MNRSDVPIGSNCRDLSNIVNDVPLSSLKEIAEKSVVCLCDWQRIQYVDFLSYYLLSLVAEHSAYLFISVDYLPNLLR